MYSPWSLVVQPQYVLALPKSYPHGLEFGPGPETPTERSFRRPSSRRAGEGKGGQIGIPIKIRAHPHAKQFAK